MPKYNVHIMPVVRVLIKDVEADSMEEAVQIAKSSVDLYDLFNMENSTKPWSETEYTENISEVLVDVVGDEDNLRSRWFDSDGKPIKEN